MSGRLSGRLRVVDDNLVGELRVVESRRSTRVKRPNSPARRRVSGFYGYTARFALLVLAVLLLLQLLHVADRASAGYWEPIVPDRVARGYPIFVRLYNHGLPSESLKVAVADPWGEELLSFSWPLAQNWTDTSFQVQTEKTWDPGIYMLKLESPSMRTLITVEVVRNEGDWYAALQDTQARAEQGEAGWPAVVVALAVFGWLCATYFSYRILKWRSSRPITSTNVGSLKDHIRGLLRFNLAHDPRTWLKNKRLAALTVKKRQHQESLAEIEAALARAKTKDGVRDVQDLALAAMVPPTPEA